VKSKAKRQVTIELNDRQVTQAFNQGLRERGKTRPNFNHGLTGLRMNGIDNAINDAAVG
jgi:hypothetical protein